MKKTICLSISMLLLTFSDSVYEKIDNANRSNTIQIYNGTFMHLFAERKSIEQIITDESLLDPYYAVKGIFSSPCALHIG